MALYGLRYMDSTTPEVRVILGALLYKMRAAELGSFALELRELSMALVGILGTSSWIRDDFMAVLAQKNVGFTYVE